MLNRVETLLGWQTGCRLFLYARKETDWLLRKLKHNDTVTTFLLADKQVSLSSTVNFLHKRTANKTKQTN